MPWALLLAQSNITDINKEVGGREREVEDYRERERERLDALN